MVVRPRTELAAALGALSGRTVRLDPEATPAWFAATLRAAGATIAPGDDPCRLPRACKNPVEQAGARAAHHRDAVALARFLAWFAAAAPTGQETEISAADRLLAYRQEVPLFQAESFPAISGAGENGAIVHYRVTPETDRAIRPDECYLIDSRRPIPRRHHRRDPHPLDRAGPGAGEPARPLHPRAAGPYRPGGAALPEGHRRARISTPSPGARCGRRGSTSTMAPGTASAASCRCMRGRSR